MKITEKKYTTYTKNGKSYIHVIYDPKQDTQNPKIREEIRTSTKERYEKQSIYFEEKCHSLKSNLNTKVLKNTGSAFEEYDTRGRDGYSDAAKKSASIAHWK